MRLQSHRLILNSRTSLQPLDSSNNPHRLKPCQQGNLLRGLCSNRRTLSSLTCFWSTDSEDDVVNSIVLLQMRLFLTNTPLTGCMCSVTEGCWIAALLMLHIQCLRLSVLISSYFILLFYVVFLTFKTSQKSWSQSEFLWKNQRADELMCFFSTSWCDDLRSVTRYAASALEII